MAPHSNQSVEAIVPQHPECRGYATPNTQSVEAISPQHPECRGYRRLPPTSRESRLLSTNAQSVEAIEPPALRVSRL